MWHMQWKRQNPHGHQMSRIHYLKNKYVYESTRVFAVNHVLKEYMICVKLNLNMYIYICLSTIHTKIRRIIYTSMIQLWFNIKIVPNKSFGFLGINACQFLHNALIQISFETLSHYGNFPSPLTDDLIMTYYR